MKAAMFIAGLTLGLYLATAWERFAYDDQHRYLAERAAFCQGELAQLLTSAAQCEGRLESVSLELVKTNTDHILEASGRPLAARRGDFYAQGGE